MIPDAACSLCGQHKAVIVVVAGVDVLVCPACDRFPCKGCGETDLSGRRRTCSRCETPIGLHAGGG